MRRVLGFWVLQLLAVPTREKAGPFRPVVKLLRHDGGVAMERVLASQ